MIFRVGGGVQTHLLSGSAREEALKVWAQMSNYLLLRVPTSITLCMLAFFSIFLSCLIFFLIIAFPPKNAGN